MIWILLADVPPPPPPQANAKANPFLNPDFLLTVGLLVGALLVGAIAFALVDRWRKRQADPGSARESTESLTSFRAMYESGELSKEEYERIRNRVAARMKQEVGVASLGGTSPETRPGGGGLPGAADRGEFNPGDGSPGAPAPGPSAN